MNTINLVRNSSGQNNRPARSPVMARLFFITPSATCLRGNGVRRGKQTRDSHIKKVSLPLSPLARVKTSRGYTADGDLLMAVARLRNSVCRSYTPDEIDIGQRESRSSARPHRSLYTRECRFASEYNN